MSVDREPGLELFLPMWQNGDSVSRRRREIGIRIALGATNERVVRRLLRDGLVMTVMGLGAGLALALLAGGSLQSLLYGIDATDPVTLGVAATSLGAVAVLASWIPARRALAIDPAEAVKGDG